MVPKRNCVLFFTIQECCVIAKINSLVFCIAYLVYNCQQSTILNYNFRTEQLLSEWVHN